MLEKVKYANYEKGIDIESYTDGYAYDEYSSCYLMSVLGHDSSVKAITAALVSGGSIEVLADSSIDLSKSYVDKYRILSSKLGNGLLHQIALADSFLGSSDNGHKLLYIDREENAPRIVYESIKKKYSVPLIPEWSLWLYKKLGRENHLDELSGTRKVIKLTVSEEELDSIISEGIKNSKIVF